MSETKQPKVWYSEPYQCAKKQWHVNKHENGKRSQIIDIWTQKLCYEFLREIKIHVDGKLCYTGI